MHLKNLFKVIIRLFSMPISLFLYRIISYPYPYRTALMKLFSSSTVSKYYRPHYYSILYETVRLASSLKYEKISCIEFGVAGGNGLLALEKYTNRLEKAFSIKIEIYGFDNGIGLPRSNDYRDLPFIWSSGDFAMDLDALKKKIKKSKLIIGDVKETVGGFTGEYSPAPIGCIFFDLDYYTSTKEAMKIFNQNLTDFLPRVICYFDNVLGSVNNFNGELLAINQFNEENKMKKIAKDYGTITDIKYGCNFEQVFILHLFEHNKYSVNSSNTGNLWDGIDDLSL